MAPRWPQVNNGPEHINEHATYLREACNQLQAVESGRVKQVPWKVVQPYLSSTLALIGKVLRQPAIGEILQHVQEASRCTQKIQNDITVIKNSVGLSTSALSSANFTGQHASTWAQVAAQAKGSHPPPPPSPPTNRSQSSVTAYKDRVITVKLRDRGIAQRYRAQPASRTRQQIEALIQEDPTTRSVNIVAAHQLKSGDIQIFTGTTDETKRLKHNRAWLRGLGEQAELMVPTYGVIVHGIATNSINLKDQEGTAQQLIADNHSVIPNAKITYVGWLTKESTLKRASSIVVEFTEPEAANAVIYAGMAWAGQIHQCQLYDRACRVKQCFRCHNYGHIGTQCHASQVCGYCTGQHETKYCKEKEAPNFTPRCAVCKEAHTAWSNACPARKKEMRRIECAKGTRSIYWDVPRTDTQHQVRHETNTRENEHAAARRVETAATARHGESHNPVLPVAEPRTEQADVTSRSEQTVQNVTNAQPSDARNQAEGVSTEPIDGVQEQVNNDILQEGDLCNPTAENVPASAIILGSQTADPNLDPALLHDNWLNNISVNLGDDWLNGLHGEPVGAEPSPLTSFGGRSHLCFSLKRSRNVSSASGLCRPLPSMELLRSRTLLIASSILYSSRISLRTMTSSR